MKSFTERYNLPLFATMVDFTLVRVWPDEAPEAVKITPYFDDAIDAAVQHATEGRDAWVVELTANGEWRELESFDPRDYDPSMMEVEE